MKSKFWYLTKLSIKKKLFSKWFIGVQILLLVLTIGISNINHVIKMFGGDFEDVTKIIVVDETGHVYDALSNTYTTYKVPIDSLISTEMVKAEKGKTLDELKEEIDKNIILIISESETTYITASLISQESINMAIDQVLKQAINDVKTMIAFEQSNINPEELAAIYAPIEVQLETLNENANTTGDTIMMAVGMPIGIIVFMLVIFMVQMIGAEINDEKTTKSMEIIISSVTPEVHLFSKVLASITFALTQALLFFSYAVAGYVVGKMLSPTNAIEPGSLIGYLDSMKNTFTESGIITNLWYIIPLILVLVVVTFICYAILTGILTSMTTNMEDFQQLQTPIMIISIFGYYLALLAPVFSGSVFIRVMACVPFISVMLAPGMLAAGYLTLIEFIIAIVLMVAIILLLLKYGLRIYRAGILNYSSKKLWTKMLRAAKNTD